MISTESGQRVTRARANIQVIVNKFPEGHIFDPGDLCTLARELEEGYVQVGPYQAAFMNMLNYGELVQVPGWMVRGRLPGEPLGFPD